MCPKISLLSIFLMFPCIAFASATWTNEPGNSKQLVDCPFNNLSDCHITGGGPSIVADGTAPISPSNVAKSTLYAGANTGGSEIHYGTPAIYRELFLGLMWRTNSQFYGRQVANKMFFVRGPISNGFFGMYGGPAGVASFHISWCHNSGNIDNSHTCGDGGFQCYPNKGSGNVSPGVWTKIEAYVKASTTNTSRDGIVRWWINGTLAGEYLNMNVSSRGLNEWVWSETWDGTVNPVPAVEWNHFIDHLYVSAPNAPAIPVVTIAPASLPSAVVGAPYSATLTASGGIAPYTWFVVAGGTLPAGLKLNQLTGVISGTTTTAGTGNFTIKATDKSIPAVAASQAYSITTTGKSGINGSVVGNHQALDVRRIRSHGGMVFSVVLPQSSRFSLEIFDSQGRMVWTHTAESTGSANIPWEGGRQAKPGVYVVQLRQGNERTSRMLLVE